MKKTLIYLGIVIILGVGVFFVITPPPFGHLYSHCVRTDFRFERKSPCAGEEIRTNENLPLSATLNLENGQEIKLRVADNDQERTLGLSRMRSLPKDQGMLFIFDQPGMYSFWMKDMHFPLDIIWLKKESDQEYRIVSVQENITPDTYPQTFSSQEYVDAVLEINKGSASVYNLVSGKKMWISFKE